MTNTTTTRKPRPNNYPGNCTLCSSSVPAGRGFLGPKVGNRWTVTCRSCSPAVGTAMEVSDDPEYARLVQDGASHDATAFGRGVAAELDARYTSWVGELLMENGGILDAFGELAACSEWWDGEPQERAYAAGKFVSALPGAVAQNVAIHGRPW